MSERLVRFTHLGRVWEAVLIGKSWFARDPQGNDTGPYSTWREAFDWVTAIRP